MRYPLKSVLNGMRVVIKRINAPFASLSVVARVDNTVYCRVTHVYVGRRHIYFCTKSFCPIGKLPVFHPEEEIKIFFNGPVAIRAVLSRLGKCAAVFSHLIRCEVADICFPCFYKSDRELKALIKIIGAVINPARRLASEPAEVLVYALHILIILFRGVRVIIAEIEEPAVFLCGHGVYPYRLSRTYVKISVGLGRKARMNLERRILGYILINNLVNKVVF